MSQSLPSSLWTESDSDAAFALYSEITKSVSHSPDVEYKDYLQRVANHVNCLAAAEEDKFCQQGESLKAQTLLLEFAAKVFIRQLEKDNEPASQTVLLVLNSCMSLFEKYDTHWRDMVAQRDATFSLMKEDILKAKSEIEGVVHSSSLLLQPPSQAESPPPAQKSSLVKKSRKSTSLTHRSPSDAREITPKPLRLKQLKSCIEEIYASKARYDEKCKENNLPFETMEQHMYTYLNHKYGLKDLVIVWATAIINGVQKYAEHDNDVVVFGKILRNEIDEEFRLVQSTLRDTVRELLVQSLKYQYPLKIESEINQLVKKKMEKGLAERDWVSIVEYMYNKNDAAAISSIIRSDAFHSVSPRRSTKDILIPYDDFISLLLNFQLAIHEKFLEPLVEAFRKVDESRSGVIDGVGFRTVVLTLKEDALERDIDPLLQQVDPLGSQVITFSRCCSVLGGLLTELNR